MNAKASRNLFFYVATLWITTISVNAQTERPNIRLSLSSPDSVRIYIQLPRPVKSWSFLNNYGAVMNLGSRVHEFQARGIDGQTVPVRNIAPGEFRSEEAVTEVDYSVRLAPSDINGAAHVSWLTQQTGLLMFADLLPRDLDKPVFVEFRLPDTWDLETAVPQDEKYRFVVDDPTKAVFLAGSAVRAVFKTVEGMSFDFAFSGSWSFKDGRVAKSASTLLKKYFELTGFRLPKRSMVLIAPLPSVNNDVRWTAETRGSTVILLLDPRTPFRNWVPQLEVIFTHELFHLWVPNSLRLEGDYDWFFEGFTLYQALLTARESQLISFQEYLDTLARVYDSYRSNPDPVSLIEASEQRWSGFNSAVYDKGMLVAFVYDLMLRQESGGKTGLSEKYRQLFKEYGAKVGSANEAIMVLLISSSATHEFLKTHVESKKFLDLEVSLNRYGLLVDSKGSSTHLRVADNLREDQFRLLQTLGYKRR